MNAKPFTFAIAAVLILGIGLGGSFVAGVALGRTQVEPEQQISFPIAPSAQARTEEAAQSGQVDEAQLQQFRQRVQSGQATEEEMRRFRAQFQSSAATGEVPNAAAGAMTSTPGGTAAGIGPGRGGLGALFRGTDGGTFGTVKSVEGDVLTIETLEGPVPVNVTAGSKLWGMSNVALAEFTVDATVVVTGARTESGEIVATSVVEMPAELLGPIGAREITVGP